MFYFSARNRKDVNRRIAAYRNWQWWIYMLFRAHTHLLATRQGTTYKHHMPGRFCTFPGHSSLYSYPLRGYLCLMLESAFIARLGNSCSIHFRCLVIRDMQWNVDGNLKIRVVKVSPWQQPRPLPFLQSCCQTERTLNSLVLLSRL